MYCAFVRLYGLHRVPLAQLVNPRAGVASRFLSVNARGAGRDCRAAGPAPRRLSANPITFRAECTVGSVLRDAWQRLGDAKWLAAVIVRCLWSCLRPGGRRAVRALRLNTSC